MTRIFGVLAATVVAVLGSATAASAKAPSERTVSSVQAHVSTRAKHITDKMHTLQTRIAANKRLSPTSKATLQADITKVTNDTATWRQQVVTAKTMAGIKAAAPAQKAVTADLAKLRTDMKTAHASVPQK